MIMVFIPLFNGVKTIGWPGFYPLMNKVWTLTPLGKSRWAFITVQAFLIPAWIENNCGRTDRQHRMATDGLPGPHRCRVLVSITCLEFSYTQAPKKMILALACFLMSVAMGNAFVAVVNVFIQNPDGSSKLAGAEYYNFFALCMLVTTIVFIPVAKAYKEKTYMQDELETGAMAEAGGVSINDATTEDREAFVHRDVSLDADTILDEDTVLDASELED